MADTQKEFGFPKRIRVHILKKFPDDVPENVVDQIFDQAKKQLVEGVPEEIIPRVKFSILHYPEELVEDKDFLVYGVVATLSKEE